MDGANGDEPTGGCDALRKGGAAPGVATSRPNSSPAQPTQPGL